MGDQEGAKLRETAADSSIPPVASDDCAAVDTTGGQGEDMRHILALDQGTTSSRALLFDTDSRIVAMAQREHLDLLCARTARQRH